LQEDWNQEATKMFTVLVLFWFFSAILVDANRDVLIAPPMSISSDALAKKMCLIFIPGAGITPEAYIPLMEKIQYSLGENEVEGKNEKIALWVGIPHMPFNTAAIGLKAAVQRISDALLLEQDFPQDGHLTMYSGHSLGGAMIPGLVNTTADLPIGFDNPIGMVLMGAFLTRSFKSVAIPDVGPGQYSFDTCPVLTIGGELDGLCRITRIAEAHHTQIDMAIDPIHNKKYFPVTVIEGMSHMQFASGEPPILVQDRDLKPEISDDDAHQLITNDFVAFVNSILFDNNLLLQQRQDSSANLFKPIISALQLEGYHQFLPPCYCEAIDEYGGLEYGTCPEMPGCQSNTPWTNTANLIMLGGNEPEVKGLSAVSMDSQHIVTEEDPSCHLPKIHQGYNSETDETISNTASGNPGNPNEKFAPYTPPLCSDPYNCKLSLTTITQVMYEVGSEFDIWRILVGSDAIDTAFLPISGHELKTKMKSRQALWQAANVSSAMTDDSLERLDGIDAARCAEINVAAIETAFNMLPENTRKRYENVGQHMQAANVDLKIPCGGGPCWIWDPIRYIQDDDNNILTIMSPSFNEPNGNPFPCGEKNVEGKLLPCPAGMHYCKLLSPARAIEWMYVDSLRLHSSIKPPKEEKCCDSCGEGLDMYYSIDDHWDRCGQACFNPDDYDFYHKFEKNLLPAGDSNTPCFDRSYTRYVKTTTHEAGDIAAATFDMYDNDNRIRPNP